MKIQTKDLTGLQLDCAIAAMQGWTLTHDGIQPLLEQAGRMIPLRGYAEHAAGDIIDKQEISVIRCDDEYAVDAKGFCTNVRIPVWAAAMGQHSADNIYGSQGDDWGRAYSINVDDVSYGATRREAAMRAFLRQAIGETVVVPEGLA